MKRIIFALLALTLLISMASCAETAKETETMWEATATEETIESDEYQLWKIIAMAEDYLFGQYDTAKYDMEQIINQYGHQDEYYTLMCNIYNSVDDHAWCQKYIQEARALLGC